MSEKKMVSESDPRLLPSTGGKTQGNVLKLGNNLIPEWGEGGGGDVSHADFADVNAIDERYNLADVKGKVNQMLAILKGSALAVAAMVAVSASAAVSNLTARLDALYNDSLVVTNVLDIGGSSGGGVTTNDVKAIVTERGVKVPERSERVNSNVPAWITFNRYSPEWSDFLHGWEWYSDNGDQYINLNYDENNRYGRYERSDHEFGFDYIHIHAIYTNTLGIVSYEELSVATNATVSDSLRYVLNRAEKTGHDNMEWTCDNPYLTTWSLHVSTVGEVQFWMFNGTYKGESFGESQHYVDTNRLVWAIQGDTVVLNYKSVHYTDSTTNVLGLVSYGELKDATNAVSASLSAVIGTKLNESQVNAIVNTIVENRAATLVELDKYNSEIPNKRDIDDRLWSSEEWTGELIDAFKEKMGEGSNSYYKVELVPDHNRTNYSFHVFDKRHEWSRDGRITPSNGNKRWPTARDAYKDSSGYFYSQWAGVSGNVHRVVTQFALETNTYNDVNSFDIVGGQEVQVVSKKANLTPLFKSSNSELAAAIEEVTCTNIIDHTNAHFSNEVLAVGLGIDTNSVAVLNEIAAGFGNFPLSTGETATTIGGLLAALAAAIAWLKKNKVGSFSEVGGVTPTVSNGVANLLSLFTSENSSLDASNVNYTNSSETPTTVKAKIQSIETTVGTANASLETALGTAANA